MSLTTNFVTTAELSKMIKYDYDCFTICEQTDLKDNPVNCKRLQTLLDRVKAEIVLGQFDYRATFPSSPILAKLDTTAQVKQNNQITTPTKKAFAAIWFEHSKVIWRKSYSVAVANIIQMSEPVFQVFVTMKLHTAYHKYVFVNKPGKPIEHNGVTKRLWYPLLKHLGLPRHHLYQIPRCYFLYITVLYQI